MKKTAKWMLLILAVLTMIAVIAAIVMLRTVSGDTLFYLDSRVGNIYAVSYRWVCLVAALLILFWLLLGFRKRSVVKARFLALKPKKKAVAKKKADKKLNSKPPAEPPQKEIICTGCGKKLTGDHKFCPFCGKQF